MSATIAMPADASVRAVAGPTHLYDLVRQRARRDPRAVAIGGQEGLTWKTLDGADVKAHVDGLAAQLRDRLGVRPGDRIVLWVPNGWRTPVYYWACWALGAVVVPLDRESNPEAAARIVASTEPRAVILGYDETPRWADGLAKAVRWWTPEPGPPLPWERPDEELAVLFFTSGTTGTPKGCEITHANLLSQVAAFADNIPLGAGDRLCSVLPLSHALEVSAGLLYPFARGAAIHYAPSRRGPDALRVLQEQRVTHLIGVPQLLSLMGRSVEQQLGARLPRALYAATMAAAERLPLGARRHLPPLAAVHRKLGGRLEMVASGGAPLAPETQLLWERLGVRIVQGYGTSECSPVVACGLPDGSTPLGSVGRPIRGVEVRLGGDGELLVRGPNVMRGYWRDPARTAEVLVDGWYHTGDLAEQDAVGNLRITGRARDLIVLPSGQKVHPTDVEDVLRADPAVADAAVVAVPTNRGLKLHAYLIPDGPHGDAAAVAARANARLALHQRVATASWWPEPDFPRTTTLKVRRNLLPTTVEAAPTAPEPTTETLSPDDPVVRAVAAAAQVEPSALTATMTLGSLGIDSLAMTELAVALEEATGRQVDENLLADDVSLANLCALTSAAPEAGEGPVEDDGAETALWPYTWGRALRVLALPWDLLYRLTVPRTVVLGAKHLAGLDERVVLAGTHRSFADLTLLRAALARTPARRLRSRMAIAAQGEHAAFDGIAGTYARAAFGLIPLAQRRGRARGLRGLVAAAAAGNAVLIFPQGQHTRPEQEAGEAPQVRFKTGVAHVAEALDAPVVPFGLAGTERIMPATLEGHRGLVVAGIPVALRRSPAAIAFGPPLRRAPDEPAAAFAQRLEAVCYALARQAEQALVR